MQTLLSDIRYALRQFRQAPAFTATAALTLALGIGGTTAIFSLIHGIMLRSLPVGDPAALYRIGAGNNCCVQGGPQDEWGMFPYELYRERIRTNVPEFTEVTAFEATTSQRGVRQGAERIARPLRTEYVEGNYFQVFGVQSYRGRLLRPEDDRRNSQPTVVMNYSTWMSKFGGDRTLVGKTLVIDSHPFTVAGIAPPGFYGETLRSEVPDLWLPLNQEPVIAGTNSILNQPITAWLRVVGRIRPGASLHQMEARLTTIARDWLLHGGAFPEEFKPMIEASIPKQFVHLVRAGGGVMAMKEEYGRSLFILLTVCGLVLLIACANIANLLLARGMARRSQFALQMAIGASRRRLVQQAMTESMVLALLGCTLGLVVSQAAQAFVLQLAFGADSTVPLGSELTGPVLAFAIGLAGFTGLLFGTAPAWLATSTEPVEALRGSGTRVAGDRSSVPQKVLLVVQASLSVVLLAGAAMLTRSLGNLEGQHIGYELRNRVMLSVNGVSPTLDRDKADAIERALLQKLQGLPGVRGAGIALYAPFDSNWNEGVVTRDHPIPQETAIANWNRVSPGFFEVIGQPLLRGRAFSMADRSGSQTVAVVNEAFAKKFLPGKNPIGEHFGMDLPKEVNRYTIIGVVKNAKYTDANETVQPMFFLPFWQRVTHTDPPFQMMEDRSQLVGGAILETSLPIGRLVPVLRRAAAEVDPGLTIMSVRTMEAQLALNFNQDRAIARLAGIFGLIALVLAAVGLYGVTSYSVARRTSEIGVRMALGAGRESVMRLVIGGAFRQVGVGLLLGIPIAIGAGKLMQSRLYDVGFFDVPALSLAIGSLAIAALLAALVPAARAAGIDPMRALKTE